MTNESNKAETKTPEQLAEDYAFQVPYNGTNEFVDEKEYEAFLAGYKAMQEYSSIQQEVFRRHLDMWLSPENSKYYWEIVKIIESLNTK